MNPVALIRGVCLLVLSVAATCLPLPWPHPPLGLGPRGSLALTAAASLVCVGAAVALSAWVVRSLRRSPARRPVVLARYVRFRRLLGYANLGVAILAVLGLGWGHTVWAGLQVDARDLMPDPNAPDSEP